MKVELIYFDLQGRATQARIMLKMAGIEFTDTRLSKEEFGEMKASFEESALGQLPVLKFPTLVNLLIVYCQSDAIMEWAADKAGLIPKNDEDAMAMRMVIETIKEASVQAFGPAMKACEAAGTSFFGAEDKEVRNKVAIPALAAAMGALLPKIDKVLGMVQTNDDFAVGDSFTFADIHLFALRQFTADPLFNKYGDIKATMPPKAVKIAENVAKHPVVADYLKTDGHLPYTGLMIFY